MYKNITEPELKTSNKKCFLSTMNETVNKYIVTFALNYSTYCWSRKEPRAQFNERHWKGSVSSGHEPKTGNNPKEQLTYSKSDWLLQLCLVLTTSLLAHVQQKLYILCSYIFIYFSNTQHQFNFSTKKKIRFKAFINEVAFLTALTVSQMQTSTLFLQYIEYGMSHWYCFIISCETFTFLSHGLHD